MPNEAQVPATPVQVAPSSRADNGGLRTAGAPLQDPTALTTQQLQRENFWLREVLETRLTSLEKTLGRLQAFTERSPSTADVEHEVTGLREVVMEKFNGIKTQLTERDAATEKASKDVKSAVDAAFAAAKEAVGEQNKSNALSITKSENTTTKQIDGIAEQIKTNSKSTDDKINDIKDRLTTIETRSGVSDPSVRAAVDKIDAALLTLRTTSDVRGGHDQGSTATWAIVFGGVGMLFGLGSLIALVVKAVH